MTCREATSYIRNHKSDILPVLSPLNPISDLSTMSQLTVYKAIDEMRELSEKKVPFSFTFMSWSETKGTSDGIIEVQNGRLKNRTTEADYLNAEVIEEYIDLDIMEHRRFYHPLLMTFNNQSLLLT